MIDARGLSDNAVRRIPRRSGPANCALGEPRVPCKFEERGSKPSDGLLITSLSATAVHDDIDRILISEQELRQGIDRVAAEVTLAYAGRDFTVVAVLKGSCVFASDLIDRDRRLPGLPWGARRAPDARAG